MLPGTITLLVLVFLFPFFFPVGKIKAFGVKYFLPFCVLWLWEWNDRKWASRSFVYVFFFSSVWFYVGMAGAFCFILIQLVLLIDFAHSWNESWVEKMEEGNSRCWYAGKLLSFTEHLQDSWTSKIKAHT